MKNTIQIIDAFFTDYEAVFNHSLTSEPDVDAVTRCFADCFVESNPLGVRCGKNDEEFRKSIPQGYAFYRSIGTDRMKIRSAETIALDELNYMTRVHWSAWYRKKNAEELEIRFNVIFFTQLIEGQPKIFAYITGDEQKVLRENGLIE